MLSANRIQPFYQSTAIFINKLLIIIVMIQISQAQVMHLFCTYLSTLLIVLLLDGSIAFLNNGISAI